MAKSITTTMPSFDGKSEKFELFGELFQTSLKVHNQLTVTEDDRIHYFYSIMRADALHTFRNNNGSTRENLGKIRPVFRRRYMKPQSMAIRKQKFQKLFTNPADQKLVEFLVEVQKLAKDAFGIAVHAFIEHIIFAKMPPHLKKSMNDAHLENGTYEQIVTHLEKELKLNGFETSDELLINAVSQHATKMNADRPKTTYHYCKKTKTLQKSVSPVEKVERNKLTTLKIILETKTVAPITLSQTTTSTIITTTTTKTVTKSKLYQKLFIHPVRHVAKRTTPQRGVMLEPMQQTGHFPGRANRKDRGDLNSRTQTLV